MVYTPEQRKKHVFDLQNALYTLALFEKTRPLVPVDGIYGEQTRKAVLVQQKKHGLSQTGNANQATWLSVFQDYALALQHRALPEPIQPFHSSPIAFPEGYIGTSIGMAQLMLWALNRIYSNIPSVPLTLTLDPATIGALHVIQEASNLPISNVLDNTTWNALTMLYNAVATEGF